MFERFRVLPIGDIFRETGSRPFPPNVANSLLQLLSTLETPAKTAIVEGYYIDVDYSASYYDQRGRSFTPDKRGTTRVHFFSKDLPSDAVTIADTEVVKTMQGSYLGFTVLRPETPVTLGRTFFACPGEISGLPVRFPTRGVTHVDLAGISLKVDSCPFMSQDAKIMACATASLWMSTSNLAEKLNSVASHSTAQITSLAMSLERPFGTAVGLRGLSLVEMEQALFRMGYHPRRHDFPTADRVIEICHLYADSGIPPVLGIEFSGGRGHAVTVVGYTLQKPSSPEPSAQDMFSAHQYVPYLVIHDDQRGMYLLAEVEEVRIERDPRTALLKIYAADGIHEALCTGILIPSPARVMLDALEALTQAEIWIPIGKDSGAIEDREVVYRKLLVRSNTYKQTLLEHRRTSGNPQGYPQELVDFARALPMPRYIWLIEVSYMDEWDPADPLSPEVVAEFVLDSTWTESRRPDFLLAHYPGRLYGNMVTENKVDFMRKEVSSDGTHRPFLNIPRP